MKTSHTKTKRDKRFKMTSGETGEFGNIEANDSKT